MKITQTILLTGSQKQDILRLWNAEYPAHLNHENITGLEQYLADLSEPLHFLIEDEEGRIQGWLTTFTRDEGRWFAMIVHKSLQGQGVGSRLLNEAKKQEPELNGWATDHDRDKRADGQAYRSPIQFYLKNGFEVLPNTRLEKGLLSAVKIRWVKRD